MIILKLFNPGELIPAYTMHYYFNVLRDPSGNYLGAVTPDPKTAMKYWKLDLDTLSTLFPTKASWRGRPGIQLDAMRANDVHTWALLWVEGDNEWGRVSP